MNKYPVIYKGKEYEVRWEDEFIRKISIYEARKIFGIKYFKNIYTEPIAIVDKYIKEFFRISNDDPNYHIEEAKCLFYMMESKKEKEERQRIIKNMQKKELEEWNGVIDG